MVEYTRNCPKCNKVLYYKTKYNRAEKKNRLCNFGNCSRIIDRLYKSCIICNIEQSVNNFYKNKNRPDGLCHICKKCDITKRVKFATYQYANDIQYKLSMILRLRINQAIKYNHKSGSAVRDLGCSISNLKLYLERQFYLNKYTKDKMTWDNLSRNGWNIDHIKPLCSFDLTDRNQFLEACHYTNLQPLWVEDHRTKSAKDIKSSIKLIT